MIDSIASMYRLILPGYRLRFFGIAAMSVFVAILETFGVASIAPLIAVMVNPQAVAKAPFVADFLAATGLSPAVLSIHVAGSITVALFIISNVAMLVLSWWSVRFTAHLATSLSSGFARSQFRRPFSFFMTHPPAQLANKMCAEIGRLASGGILQLCFSLSRFVQILFILSLLLLVAPVFAGLFFSVTALLYVLVYRYSSVRLNKTGTMALEASSLAMHRATEMYAMAREILLAKDCDYFVRRVCAVLDTYYRADAIQRILPTLPKYVLETVAVCALLAIPIYRSLMGQDASAELPLLATFAYGGFRLLPIIQQLYTSLSILNFHQAVADEINNALRGTQGSPDPQERFDKMPDKIQFKSVSYRYAEGGSDALSNATFEISRGERIAVAGPSGAGKSTLIDLLLGLLTPSGGDIVTGGISRFGKGISWRAGGVGYVPQVPLILSDTIAKNIAFGLDTDEIDFDRCRRAALAAGIDHVIDAQALGLDAIIGTDVLNFSGGERQRLVIARAIYSDPALLVLDEPASALDPPTSRKIFDLLCSPRLDATVIAITHDTQYLPLFDKVIFMEDNEVVMTGTFDDLMLHCPAFAEFQMLHPVKMSQ